MEHVTRQGDPKIVERCTYPLTGKSVVNRVITDLAVIDVTRRGLVLVETSPGVTEADVRAATGAPSTERRPAKAPRDNRPASPLPIPRALANEHQMREEAE